MHLQWLRRPPAVVAPRKRRLMFQAQALALAKLPELMQATLPELKNAKLPELMQATLPELKQATHATKVPTHVSGQGAGGRLPPHAAAQRTASSTKPPTAA